MTVVTIIWSISGGLLAISVFLCTLLTFRRCTRNFVDRARIRHNAKYDELIAEVLNNPSDPDARKRLFKYRGSATALNRSLLNYFRTVRGRHADALRQLIRTSNFERRILSATQNGTRGRRMRALQVLSYVQTPAALNCVRRHLRSSNRYERLTAARALARQKSLSDCGAVVASLASSFPRKPQLVAEVLVSFGAEVQTPLERIILKSNREIVITACLEALVVLSPVTTNLDLSALMRRQNSDVRAAAVSLSAISDDTSGADLLVSGLKDDAIAVKIRAAKIACEVSRRDLAPQLYTLTKDPSFWVRYWAVRAIWKLGRTGRQMVASLARENEPGSEMAAGVLLEMEAANG